MAEFGALGLAVGLWIVLAQHRGALGRRRDSTLVLLGWVLVAVSALGGSSPPRQPVRARAVTNTARRANKLQTVFIFVFFIVWCSRVTASPFWGDV